MYSLPDSQGEKTLPCADRTGDAHLSYPGHTFPISLSLPVCHKGSISFRDQTTFYFQFQNIYFRFSAAPVQDANVTCEAGSDAHYHFNNMGISVVYQCNGSVRLQYSVHTDGPDPRTDTIRV